MNWKMRDKVKNDTLLAVWMLLMFLAALALTSCEDTKADDIRSQHGDIVAQTLESHHDYSHVFDDTDSGVDPNDFFTTDPNVIITFDAWIPEPTDLIFYDKVTFKWVDGKFDVIYDANDLTEAAEAFFFGIAPYLNAHIKDAAEKLNERVSQ